MLRGDEGEGAEQGIRRSMRRGCGGAEGALG